MCTSLQTIQSDPHLYNLCISDVPRSSWYPKIHKSRKSMYDAWWICKMENQLDGINSEGGKDVLLISRGTNTNPTSILIPTKPSAEKTKFVDTGKCIDGDGYLTTGWSWHDVVRWPSPSNSGAEQSGPTWMPGSNWLALQFNRLLPQKQNEFQVTAILTCNVETPTL